MNRPGSAWPETAMMLFDGLFQGPVKHTNLNFQHNLVSDFKIVI